MKYELYVPVLRCDALFLVLEFMRMSLSLHCKSMDMRNKKLRITEKDFLLANRRASRAEEIGLYGKQVRMRSMTHKSKKVYDRKRMKKAGVRFNDDLPFLFCDYVLSSQWTVCADPLNLSRAALTKRINRCNFVFAKETKHESCGNGKISAN